MDRLGAVNGVLSEARELLLGGTPEAFESFRQRVSAKLLDFQYSLEQSTKAASVRAEQAAERLAEVLADLPGYGLTVDPGSGKVVMVGLPVPALKDPWDRGATYVCGTCMHYLEKGRHDESSTVGRCKERSPTMRGYPAVYSSERACGRHKLETSKA